MSAIRLPKTVVDRLDARRRAFLWTGEEKCHGSRCLLAWERVCQTKEDGGLGLKNLEDMNHSLLLKIAHRLHDHSSLPWKDWFLSQNSPVLSDPQDTYLLGPNSLAAVQSPLSPLVTGSLPPSGMTAGF